MNFCIHKIKKKILTKMMNSNGIMFHIAGIICIIWFLIRVVPKPDRITYPCQQISKSIAVGYIAFWSVLWGSLFFGLGLWVKRVKLKTTAFLPVILTVFVLIFSVTSNIYAETYIDEKNEIEIWEPIPNQPIGTPRGVNPGRVTWVWDPDATESELTGFWWYKENNHQTAIDKMFSSGIQELSGETDDYTAWDTLFRYFNQVHGRGDIGYQHDEKIAIKINMNNCYGSYNHEDNDRDASPYVVKALLRHLVDTVGVAQEDIIIYDATRPIPDWFYNRVYYETYPDSSLIQEFKDVNFIDAEGGASGRQKVVASTQRIYFSNGLYRTLPICVIDADYIINMPLLKRHPLNNGNGVTLSGKNMFGTWIEDVAPIHTYHESGHILGNPAPQTDLLAHEHIGGKTLLYIGDGMYGTLIDHRTIGKFQMYPFNNDWTNSLFFSQDPVAIDSVMYDFLHTEGTNPSEGSQNYLHQAAEPPPNLYDPESDGEYLSDSLGVHEHWDPSIGIFSSDRYSGPDGNGIDYIAIGNGSSSPNPPNTPSTPTGPATGTVGVSYSYSTSTIDPDNNKVKYGWDWDGNGLVDDWSGLLSSGAPCTMSHSWGSTNTYQVKVKAQDEYGAESGWSDPLSVSMPRNKPYIITPFPQFLQNFLQNHPHLFPILRQILGLQ